LPSYGDDPGKVDARADDLLAGARDRIVAALGNFRISQGQFPAKFQGPGDIARIAFGGRYCDVDFRSLDGFQSAWSEDFASYLSGDFSINAIYRGVFSHVVKVY
jgi:hypothetical protein